MRLLLSLALAALLGACSSTEYRDTTASVDANPLCVGSQSDKSGNTGLMECERKAEAVLFRSGTKGQPVDLTGKKDD